MKTLYFYIGTPTTSGSTLKFFMNKNIDLLNKNGIGFPKMTNIQDLFNEHILFDEDEPGIIRKRSFSNKIAISRVASVRSVCWDRPLLEMDALQSAPVGRLRIE